MIRSSLRNVLKKAWSRIRALFSRTTVSSLAGRESGRVEKNIPHKRVPFLARTTRVAAVITAGILCSVSVSTAVVPVIPARTPLSEEATTGDDTDESDLAGPESSGPIKIQMDPEIPAVSIEPIVPEERVSLLSRGMAVDAILDADVNPVSDSSPSSPDPQPEPEPTPVPVVFPTECEVMRGETVWAIAERMYGSADYVRLISYANGLSYSDPVIFAGQILSLPDPSTPVPAPTPAPAAPVVSSGSGTVVSGYSDAEIDLYLRIVASECGAGWSYEGSLMISQVIVNRMMTGRWGGLAGVLTAPNQFTPYGSGYYKSVTPTATQRQAALDALNGATIFGRDVLFFCTDAAYARSPWFQSLPVAATYANTYFFAP